MKKNFLLCAFLLATTLAWSQNVPRRMVCLEIETSTLCTYCPGAAMGAEDMLANGKQVAVVENHCNGLGNDPYRAMSAPAHAKPFTTLLVIPHRLLMASVVS